MSDEMIYLCVGGGTHAAHKDLKHAIAQCLGDTTEKRGLFLEVYYVSPDWEFAGYEVRASWCEHIGSMPLVPAVIGAAGIFYNAVESVALNFLSTNCVRVPKEEERTIVAQHR